MKGEGEIRDAVVLLAGAGSRLLGARGAIPKPLVPVLGRPLIAHILRALDGVGVRSVHGVVGAGADDVISGIADCLPPPMTFNRIDNRQWQLQNGVSVLAAAPAVDRPFLLVMGDHLFEPAILRRLIDDADRRRLTLAVDRKVGGIFDLADATKVCTEGRRIVSISKNLATYDAIDTGVFLCSPELFDYLERAKVRGDCSLSDGVQLMANDGKAEATDIEDAWWQDVDTPAMLQRAEESLPDSLRLTADAPLAGG
ncbi:MAG: NTP transferase domain-containing protein [Chthoniobacterales bacterium]